MALQLPELASYLKALDILVADFLRLTEYVEPCDANLGIFSHRLYELQLRACTEFESICKELLVHSGSTKDPKGMNIHDYKLLEPLLRFEQLGTAVFCWHPESKIVRPFDGWSTASPPLPWYQAYNTVKHNRRSEFRAANLRNTLDAICAVFAVVRDFEFSQAPPASHLVWYQERVNIYGRQWEQFGLVRDRARDNA